MGLSPSHRRQCWPECRLATGHVGADVLVGSGAVGGVGVGVSGGLRGAASDGVGRNISRSVGGGVSDAVGVSVGVHDGDNFRR